MQINIQLFATISSIKINMYLCGVNRTSSVDNASENAITIFLIVCPVDIKGEDLQ